MTQNLDYNGCFSSYTITRTWTATDDCGNSSSATQIVIVDTTAPEFTLVPASYSVECTDEVTYENATAADNCAGFSMELATDTVFSDCDNVYDIVRTCDRDGRLWQRLHEETDHFCGGHHGTPVVEHVRLDEPGGHRGVL